MTSFSERMGFVKPPEFMQLDEMTTELSNLLQNFCMRLLNSGRCHDISSMEDQLNDLLKKRKRSFQCWVLDIMGYSACFDEDVFGQSYGRLGFHEKYSLLELIVPEVGGSAGVGELNSILERENSAYRMNEEFNLVPISNEEEISSVSISQKSQIGTVGDHMNQAVTLFADRQNPDYTNSIKEAVSALEALAQDITGNPRGTLGQLIKEMDIHPSLKEAVSKLYGYASDGGIRHAKKDGDPDADFDTAKFVIVTASALVNFISAKSVDE